MLGPILGEEIGRYDYKSVPTAGQPIVYLCVQAVSHTEFEVVVPHTQPRRTKCAREGVNEILVLGGVRDENVVFISIGGSCISQFAISPYGAGNSGRLSMMSTVLTLTVMTLFIRSRT